MTSREILRRLAADGWYVIRRKGSHVQLRHPVKPERVTVVHPRQDYPIGTLKSIEKQSGVVLWD